MADLSKFFFESLPGYFKYNDSYKDGNNEGLLERYLSIFQLASEQYIVDIEGLAALPSPADTQEKFLNYIANFMGSPPDTFGDEADYRILLENITLINKNRGTVDSLRNFFKVMGTDVTITVGYPIRTIYDGGFTYDGTGIHYDGFTYTGVDITVDVLDPTNIITQLNEVTLDTNTRRLVQSILLYFLPINSILKEFKYNGVAKNITLSPNLITMPISGDPLID